MSTATISDGGGEPAVKQSQLAQLAVADFIHDSEVPRGRASRGKNKSDKAQAVIIKMCEPTIPWIKDFDEEGHKWEDEEGTANTILGCYPTPCPPAGRSSGGGGGAAPSVNIIKYVQERIKYLAKETEDTYGVLWLGDLNLPQGVLMPLLQGGPSYVVKALGCCLSEDVSVEGDCSDHSKIGKWFKLDSILEHTQLFLITDTQKGGVTQVIQNSAKRKHPIVWVETIENNYDMATEGTDSRLRKSSPVGEGENSIYAAKEEKKNVFFPKWDDNDEVVAINTLNTNKLFYSNYDIDLIRLKREDDKYAVYMKLRDEDGKVIAVQGGSGDGAGVSAGKLKAVAVARWGMNVLKAGMLAFKKATDRVLSKMGMNNGNRGVERMEFKPPFMVIAKRLGDQSQALACLRDNTIIDIWNKDGTHETAAAVAAMNDTPTTNVFVTYDRLAAVAALLYRVPAVIFNWSEKKSRGAFIIYQSQLESPAAKEAAAAAEAEKYNDSIVAITNNIEAITRRRAQLNIKTLADLKGDVGTRGTALYQRLDTLVVVGVEGTTLENSSTSQYNNEYKRILSQLIIIKPLLDEFNSIKSEIDRVQEVPPAVAAPAYIKQLPNAGHYAEVDEYRQYSNKLKQYVDDLETYNKKLEYFAALAPERAAVAINIKNINKAHLFGEPPPPRRTFSIRPPRFKRPRDDELKDLREVYSQYTELKNILYCIKDFDEVMEIVTPLEDKQSNVVKIWEKIRILLQNASRRALVSPPRAGRDRKTFWIKQLCDFINIQMWTDGFRPGLQPIARIMSGGGYAGARAQDPGEQPAKANFLDYDAQVRTFVGVCMALQEPDTSDTPNVIALGKEQYITPRRDKEGDAVVQGWLVSQGINPDHLRVFGKRGENALLECLEWMKETEPEEEKANTKAGGGGGGAAATEEEEEIWGSQEMQGIIYDYFTPQFNAFWGPDGIRQGATWDEIIGDVNTALAQLERLNITDYYGTEKDADGDGDGGGDGGDRGEQPGGKKKRIDAKGRAKLLTREAAEDFRQKDAGLGMHGLSEADPRWRVTRASAHHRGVEFVPVGEKGGGRKRTKRKRRHKKKRKQTKRKRRRKKRRRKQTKRKQRRKKRKRKTKRKKRR